MFFISADLQGLFIRQSEHINITNCCFIKLPVIMGLFWKKPFTFSCQRFSTQFLTLKMNML